MRPHVCPWWGGYFIDNRLRRLLHQPETILAPYVHAGMSVLDFGCGMGFFSIPMARLVGDEGHVISVDLQPQMLSTLKRRAAKAGVAARIRVHQCERESLVLLAQGDFALAFWAAHEVPSPPRLLSELHAFLVEGGRLLLVEPRGHVTAADFQQMLADAEQLGLQLDDRPRIRLSHAALFSKPCSPTKLP